MVRLDALPKATYQQLGTVPQVRKNELAPNVPIRE